LEIARKASDIRAVSRIKTPDDIQLATALHHGATGFLTNDRTFEKVKGLEIAVLDKVMK
jgi:predicted nucleic acid-binding protein